MAGYCDSKSWGTLSSPGKSPPYPHMTDSTMMLSFDQSNVPFLLSPLPECQANRHAPPHTVYVAPWIESRVPIKHSVNELHPQPSSWSLKH